MHLKAKQTLPFLKWAGGKRWLVHNHQDLLPQQFNSYIEPFLGSGAVFFSLAPTKGILSDLNKDLIDTYIAIRDNWQTVVKKLENHQRNHSKEYYYSVRSNKPKDIVNKAAWFIYLNKTCWNGLYRVNLKGEFNVPIGTKSCIISSKDDYGTIANKLAGLEIVSDDFEKIIQKAKKNDFVFIDPPYTVKHNLNGFVKYNENLFSWRDQIRLRDTVASALRRGVKILILNADHKSIRSLYKGIGLHMELNRASVISGSPIFRGNYKELAIVCGYEPIFTKSRLLPLSKECNSYCNLSIASSSSKALTFSL